jgi:hypothetical protein
MARDGLFFAKAGELSARTGRPAAAVAMQGALACVAILVGASRVDVLLKGITFADALFQGGVAIVHLRLAGTPLPPGVLVRAPAVLAWIFLLLEVGLAIGSLAGAPVESAYGAAVLIVGVGAFWAFKRGGTS